MNDILLKDEVFAVVGAAVAVHSELGPGFLEAVYQEAMEIELRERSIPYDIQKLLPITYRGKTLSKEYIADMVCFDALIVELKALEKLSGREEAQLLNYLKASGLRVGLLINFGSHGKLEWSRFIL